MNPIVTNLYFALVSIIGVVYPLLALIQVFRGRPKGRMGWILAIALLGPFGAILFDLFSGGPRGQKIRGVIGLVCAATLFWGGAWIWVQFNNESLNELKRIEQNLPQMTFANEITADEKQKIVQSIDILQREWGRDAWSEIPRKLIYIQITKVLTEIVQDQRWTSEELNTWVTLFNNRNFFLTQS